MNEFDDSDRPHVEPSRHDMFALAMALAKESSFLIGIAKLGRRRRLGDDNAKQIVEAGPVHGDDGAQS